MRTVPLFQKRAASRGTGVLVAGVSDFGGRHTSLPNATLEARAVAGLYDGPCLLLLDGEATVEALFEATSSPESGGWRIIHLATHAYFDPLDGAFSGLAMADGDLSPMDIARLRLEGAVVVLSACQTGLQDLHAGEETVGIVSALLQAGARTVISTLWHVHDTEVPWLMVDLHRGLREGLPPAAALTRVQREAIRRGVPLYHWAAFTTVGGGWLP